MSGNMCITIGRQIGSGGHLIGEKLARDLNFCFYDKELIQIASKETGITKKFFEEADEKEGPSMFSGALDLLSSSINDVYANYFLSNETLFAMQSDVIRKLAIVNSCVFLGRCSDYVLKDHPNCLNIFICADKPDRVQRLSALRQISEKTAIDLIEKMDKKRADYYNYYSNKIWGAAKSYHLCLNSSVLGIEETARFIREFCIKNNS